MAFLLTIKGRETSLGQKSFFSVFFFRGDLKLLKFYLKLKLWWGHINFKNTKLILAWIMVNMHKLIIGIKRKFDHKQSHFFTQKDHDMTKNKGSVSFFLKDVAEYKKSLREGKGE